MMHTGSLPPTSIHGTWSENIEVRSVEDDELIDLTSVIEITLMLRDPITGLDDLTLTMTNEDITVPSTGIIQWRAEVEQMRTLNTKLYEVILLIEDTDDTVPLVLGSISIVE